MMEPDFLEEYDTIVSAMLFDGLQAINNKQKIEKFQQLILYHAFLAKNVSHTAQLYRQKIKDYSTLTPKQVKKFFRCQTTHVLDMFDPVTSEEATQNGFYGTKCPKCQSLRMSKRDTDKKGNNTRRDVLHCWACHADFRLPRAIVPKKGI